MIAESSGERRREDLLPRLDLCGGQLQLTSAPPLQVRLVIFQKRKLSAGKGSASPKTKGVSIESVESTIESSGS